MAQTRDIVMPASDQEGTESVVAHWLKSVGEYVEVHEPLLEISTDKVTIEIPSPATGVLKEIRKRPNDRVEAGEVLGVLDLAQGAAKKGSGGLAAAAGSGVPGDVNEDVSAELSPAVRKLIREHNLDISSIGGSGRGGRITHEDVMAVLQGGKGKSAAASNVIPSRKVPHSPMRRSIAEHMVGSALRVAPHVTAMFEADLSAIVAHREGRKAAYAARGIHLTFTSYFIRACCEAIKVAPEVNSRFHEDELEVFTTCNIGVATAIQGGLIVPVLHQAESLDLFQTSERLQELTLKARNNELSVADIKNGTITITNHGVGGSLFATPIINQPQSAILGIGKLEKRPIIVEENGTDQIKIKPMAYVTLTIDHRVLDAYSTNLFLAKFVEVLQHWKD